LSVNLLVNPIVVEVAGMLTLGDRFETKVDRSGDHHLWTGATKADGTGVLKVAGKVVTAPRVAWELANGELRPGVRVQGCSSEPACVRVDHLSLHGGGARVRPDRRRAARGSGSKVEVRPGVWKLTVTAGRYAEGQVRRVHRTVHVATAAEAARELAAFVTEVHESPSVASRADRDVTVDEAIERFLTEYLVGEKGRDPGTVQNYRGAHQKWFSPEIGGRRVVDVDEAAIDRVFGRMRRAGLSASRLHDARNLYQPFFRWAKRRRMIRRSPMADFELPTSTHVAREHAPPEVDQLSLYLRTAVEVVPDVAPVLTLGAVTGMRRGGLVSVRRSRLFPRQGKLTVDTSSDGRRVKSTKTRVTRDVAVDPATMAMLQRHCERMDERAAVFGVEVASDAFVFSLAPDCSLPLAADYLTKQVAVLKEHLGISNKRPETIAREDEALRLFRQDAEHRPQGKTGPALRGGLSYREIGERLGRSTKWAFDAVASAQRREQAAERGAVEAFDGSILALRRFTSSELLDAGFNISMVAQRQGHGPQVLVKHYARSRPSADRKAADHLGRVVHGRDRGERGTGTEGERLG
jgi:integrase